MAFAEVITYFIISDALKCILLGNPDGCFVSCKMATSVVCKTIKVKESDNCSEVRCFTAEWRCSISVKVPVLEHMY